MAKQRIICLLATIFLISSAAHAEHPVPEKAGPDKVESRSFSSVQKVHFDQSYGNILIKEGASKEVRLEIRYFYGEKRNVPVCRIDESNGTLSIRTEESGKHNARIDYVIMMPRSTSFSSELKYGNLTLGDFYADFRLDFKYSNLNAGSFIGNSPAITGKYSNLNVERADQLLLNCDYGNIKIKEVGKLAAQSKYSNYKLQQVGSFNLNASYGDVQVGTAGSVLSEQKYTNLRIDMLNQELQVNCSYADIQVKESSPSLEKLFFEGKYSNATIKLDKNSNARFDLSSRYGDLNISKEHPHTTTDSEINRNYIRRQGTLGEGKPQTTIRMSVSYGNINLK